MAEAKQKKTRPPRQQMPTQDPQVRIRNFDEVALGYSMDTAVTEATRCLQCKKPKCVLGCPVEVKIREFVDAVAQRDLPRAARELKEKNNLPAICGRVCPQETQCEIHCVLGKKGDPVAIGRLERFVADWELEQAKTDPELPEPSGRKVAVIGAGPAGLTCAADLARMGHEVTIFEALHEPGGVLMYGIPEFRLPKEVVLREVEYVRSLGVDVRLNTIVGKLYMIDELLDEMAYDAVFLGTGAGLPMFMHIPGENYNGVYSANEFLTRTNLMKAFRFPDYDTPIRVGDKVAVIGAGNVAMDSARCAKRLGAAEVFIIYRRSAAEVPARAEEVHHAEEEGIIFKFLTAPIEIYGSEEGWVCGLRCIKMELGEPDDSGRRRPLPIEGSEYDMEMDTVIMALGTSPNPLVFSGAADLERTRWGTVVADEETGLTRKGRVWAGGDIVTGAATVISAMGAGKRAAESINRFLMDETEE